MLVVACFRVQTAPVQPDKFGAKYIIMSNCPRIDDTEQNLPFKFMELHT